MFEIEVGLSCNDEFDTSQHDLDRFEEHFEEIEDHIDCLVCAYYRILSYEYSLRRLTSLLSISICSGIDFSLVKFIVIVLIMLIPL